MKILFSTILLMLSPLVCSSVYSHMIPTCPQIKSQQNQSSLAGRYYLNGVMELGSELLLQADGTFQWYLAYGALDQYAEGKWWNNTNCIGLRPDPQFKDLMIFPNYLKIEDQKLNVIWQDGSSHGSYQRANH